MSSRTLFPLGTASQVPTARRNHNGFFLRWDDEGILFDPGEGTQRQLTLAGIAATDITRICVTHFHGDHCLGLPGVIQRLSLDRVPHPVRVYFPASGMVFFDRLRRASIYAGLEHLDVRPIESPGLVDEDDKLKIVAARLDHEVDCLGYRVVEPDAFRVLPAALAASGLRGPEVGQLLREGRIEREGRIILREALTEPRPGQSFAFVMDTRPCPGALDLARGADLLVCESTFLESERAVAERAGHMTARQAAGLARDAGARRLVLTHFSQRYEDAQRFLDEALPIHPETELAVEPTPDGGASPIPVPRRRSALAGDGL